jgi:Ni,Fe-hydrogenase III large subunit/Ni,Fe-hydrogenase III component G
MKQQSVLGTKGLTMTETVDIVKSLETTFQNNKSVQIQAGGQLGLATIQVQDGLHREVIKTLLAVDKKTCLVTITCLDLGQNLGIFYHMRTSSGYLTIKAEVPRDNPKIASITDLIPGAAFSELEGTDLLGILYEGNTLAGHFILPENWPEGVYPLRKDTNLKDIKLEPLPLKEENEDGNVFKVIIGPQHPALIEPEKLSVTVAGERVVKVEPRLGYVHRGIEKAAESRSYIQDIYLVERVCGICNAVHATTFAEAVEKILKIDIPPRAKYIRTITLELNRLHSHLLTLGHACLEMGYETLFQYLWRDREPIMDLIELTSGNRVYSSDIAIGGVRRDLLEADYPKIRTTLEDLRKKIPAFRETYQNSRSIQLRMQGIGVLSRDDAIKLCVVGPVARASGLDIDVRKDVPYEAYAEIPFKKIVYTEGDAWARMNVRMDELDESINIILYALDHMPTGPTKIKAPRVVPAGEAIAVTEAPRGELFHYVKSNGTISPDRVKVRTPTYANLPSFLKTAIGQNFADCPVNFVSLDPCFSCTDR